MDGGKGMKNADIFLDLLNLSRKYANRGLTIDIEFSRFGMIFKGYWDITLNKVELLRFNREYSYEQLENLSDEIDIEFLIDEFKKEFEERIKEREL